MAILSAAAPDQFSVRYLPIGSRSYARVIAADFAGNFFTVSTVIQGSGRNQIRVTKTDA
jgi:hypothetical protein